MGADLEFAVPEIADVHGRENFKTTAENVEKQTLRKQLGSGGRKRSASRVIPSFVAVSGNLGRKVPVVDDVLSSHEQEFYPVTSLDENYKLHKI